MIQRPFQALSRFLVRRDGPLTQELVLEPAQFGLGRVPVGIKPDQTTNMVCGFCSTGCSLKVLQKQGEAVALVPNRDYSVNRGTACPKGWEALTPLEAPNRATTPLLRTGDALVPVSWERATAEVVARFRAIQAQHGAAAVAWLGSGQLPTEELALLGSLAKFGMGIVHGDGNTRQCMASAAVAYKQAFGFDAPPYTYRDFEESDVIVLVGSNLCIAHPIMWQRVCKNPHRPAIVVVDPRLTETAMAATMHYAVAPKGDLVLLYSVAQVLIANGWIDRPYIDAHTTGFDDYAAHVAPYTPEVAAPLTGISPERIVELARLIHQGKRVSFWWTMGVNQSHQGVRTAQAIIALALMTGNMGRPGTGANSITGQCNAMGSRIFSNTTNLLGGRDFNSASDRQAVADILNLDEGLVPREASLAYDQILDEVRAGKIRALWVIGTNPAHSWIDQGRMQEVLERLDFLVVQDMYHDTETARMAHVMLPSAGWGEKSGTFINSERRVGLIKPVRRPPGQALPDFQIFKLLAKSWGCEEMFRQWSSPEATFQILKRLSQTRPCDLTGIEDYGMLDRVGGVQWPLLEGEALTQGERRLFEDGRFCHPDGKAKFLVAEPLPLPEAPCADYPLLLLTGRGSSSQWHTQTRTKHSRVLEKLASQDVYVEISVTDAEALALASDQFVQVTSKRGTVRARAFVSNTVREGEVFMPMHYDSVNMLTFGAFDPYSRQPAFKACS
ncbi:MAG TPA: nitrate reductase, partial [Polyangiaceae bacterium]|nr:nitrate reductase [Polyangiaceae bacterium]